MRICIAGGHDQADFLIQNLKKQKHKLVVINEDKHYCERLSSLHKIPVYCGNPSKYYVLDEAGIEGFDVLVALTSSDADNLAICQFAKRCFHVKKVICTVMSPKNVTLFKELGITNVISSTYMVAQHITQATTIANLVNTLSFEDDIIISEVQIENEFKCVNRQLRDLPLPANTIICCIIRKGHDLIIPSGDSTIRGGDRLLVLTNKDSQSAALAAISR
ncbi:MAG: TrkA family potassium uptake protein [Acutalibacteraceae bacterium]|nr:TrkA family potassium uptake protein [Acutalibacteraceae bacterium]